MRTFTLSSALAALPLLAAIPAIAQTPSGADSRFTVEIEGGSVWQSRNVARIPGDTGTYIDLKGLAGSGPEGFYRITATGRVRHRQELRAVWAPLRLKGTGVMGGPAESGDETFTGIVDFDGETFETGVATEATYQFNSPRLTYRWLVRDGARDRFYVGVTALVRDAEIRLAQPGVSASNTNVGFVPLLHLAGENRFGERWRLVYELDGLAAPQGRAFDFSLRGLYDIDQDWYVGAGYRTIEGGADNDRVFNFAWLNFATVNVGYRF